MEAKSRPDDYEHTRSEVMYVTTNIPGPGVDLEEFESEFSGGCDCEIECTGSCPCTRGFVNYVNDRILDEKLSGPVVECNAHCHCGADCSNRLIQRGPLDCLIVADMGEKGQGLRTVKAIQKGQFICEYAGEVIGINEARHRIESNQRDGCMNYVLIVTEHSGGRVQRTCIDPKYFGNIGRYCNHSCAANATHVPVRVEGVIPRLCLFASRDIESGEEVTFDYAGGEACSIQNLSRTPCLCRAANCRRYLPHHPI